MAALLAGYPFPSAIARSADNQEADLDDAVRRAVGEAYTQWPNEAGFANLDEHRGPVELPVQGFIPPWAAGTLFRTGPGANKVDGTPSGTIEISHWFDGLAHIHRFDIVATKDVATKDGFSTNVFYSSRRQSDDFVRHVQKYGMRDIITFGQRSDPCIGLFGKINSTWAVSKSKRETKEAENIAVTVQVDVPGLPSKAPDGQKTVWLGTDCHLLREVDEHTLEPIGLLRQDRLLKELDGELSCAHPQRCPETRDYFNVNIKAGLPATYKIFRVSAESKETQVLATISRPGLPMAYIHSFFLSQHFVVLRVPSSHFPRAGLDILWNRNVLDALEPFSDDKKNKWFIIDRSGRRGVVAEFETEAAFFFHTVNCFDERRRPGQGNVETWRITCDTVEYPNMNILRAFEYDVLLNQDSKARKIWGTEEKARNTLPRFKRRQLSFTVGPQMPPRTSRPRLNTVRALGKIVTAQARAPGEWFCQTADSILYGLPGTAISMVSPGLRLQQVRTLLGFQSSPEPTPTINIPSPHVGELPTINPTYHTKPYRYVYSLAMSGRSTLVDTILKTDIISRDVLQWNNPRGHTPGEAIFVKQPYAVQEDEGVLLSVVLDGAGRKSYLLCLDARTMRETGRAEMDFAVGFGLHGVHVPRERAGTAAADFKKAVAAAAKGLGARPGLHGIHAPDRNAVITPEEYQRAVAAVTKGSAARSELDVHAQRKVVSVMLKEVRQDLADATKALEDTRKGMDHTDKLIADARKPINGAHTTEDIITKEELEQFMAIKDVEQAIASIGKVLTDFRDLLPGQSELPGVGAPESPAATKPEDSKEAVATVAKEPTASGSGLHGVHAPKPTVDPTKDSEILVKPTTPEDSGKAIGVKDIEAESEIHGAHEPRSPVAMTPEDTKEESVVTVTEESPAGGELHGAHVPSATLPEAIQAADLRSVTGIHALKEQVAMTPEAFEEAIVDDENE